MPKGGGGSEGRAASQYSAKRTPMPPIQFHGNLDLKISHPVRIFPFLFIESYVIVTRLTYIFCLMCEYIYEWVSILLHLLSHYYCYYCISHTIFYTNVLRQFLTYFIHNFWQNVWHILTQFLTQFLTQLLTRFFYTTVDTFWSNFLHILKHFLTHFCKQLLTLYFLRPGPLRSWTSTRCTLHSSSSDEALNWGIYNSIINLHPAHSVFQ